MKKLLILLAVCLTITLAACTATDTTDTAPEVSGTSTTEVTSDTIGESEEPTEPAEKEESTVSETATTTPTDSGSTATASSDANSSVGTNSKKTTNPPATNSQAPTQPPANSPATSQPDPQSSPLAKSTDAEIIADKILTYINQYRVAQGAGATTKLPGLTKVAQYRSGQLVSNFSHDLNATREATRYYEYGEHIVYGELDYYEHWAREAIGKSGGNASVDEIAERMATGVKNSMGHWRYVGASEYKCIAVGATYSNGQWYVCVLVSETNIYG